MKLGCSLFLLAACGGSATIAPPRAPDSEPPPRAPDREPPPVASMSPATPQVTPPSTELASVIRPFAGVWTCTGTIDLARPSWLKPPAKDGHTEMVDVAFELTFDVSGLERPTAAADDAHREPAQVVRVTTVFTQVPALIRDSLQGMLVASWRYDPTRQSMRRDFDPMFRFGPGNARWSSAQLDWTMMSTHLGTMLERITMRSPTELEVTGRYAVDGKRWTTDHAATCTKKPGP